MSNTYRLQKLTGRFKGSKCFTDRAEIVTAGYLERMAKFVEIRHWMTEQYGQSMELDYLLELKGSRSFDLKWAWKVDCNGRYFIYFNDDKILNWFTLKY